MYSQKGHVVIEIPAEGAIVVYLSYEGSNIYAEEGATLVSLPFSQAKKYAEKYTGRNGAALRKSLEVLGAKIAATERRREFNAAQSGLNPKLWERISADDRDPWTQMLALSGAELRLLKRRGKKTDKEREAPCDR